MSRRKNYQYVIKRLRNSKHCLITIFKKIEKQPLEVQKQSPEVFCKKMYFERFRKLHRKAPVLKIFFKQSCRSSVCKLFRKRMQNKCFPVKFVKLLRTPTLKNISKQLLLEVVYKKAVLKNFAVFIGGK